MALVAVADTGTFSRAAEHLGYTQSAVSQQIGTLEKIVGASLFERPGGPRPVHLTPAGETLLAHARAVLARVGSAAADLRALAAGEQGELRVGTVQSVGTKVLPRLLRRFRAEWPGIEVSFRESPDCDSLLELIESGDLDLTFVELTLEGREVFETRWLLDDPMVFVASADSPEAGRNVVSIEEVVTLPMIGTRSASCQVVIDACFRGLGTQPSYVFRSDDNPTIQGCVASGLAYAVLPMLTVNEHDPNVAVIPIDPPPPPRKLGVAWHRDRRPPVALASLIEATAEICDELDRRWSAWRTSKLSVPRSA